MATCLHPVSVHGTLVPCGKCPVCQQNKRQLLSNRMLLESAFCGGPTLFLTITYDDEHLPYYCFDKGQFVVGTGDKIINGNPCFCKKHIQNFNKYLRKLGYEYSYMFTSEYGIRTLRPHYHALLFFRQQYDIVKLNTDLQSCWTFGFIQVSLANDSRIAYAAKYVLKDNMSLVNLPNNHPAKPFRLFSSRPGIGQSAVSYLNEYIYNDGNLRKEFVIDGKRITFDRYLKNHIDPSLSEELKQKTYYEKLPEIQERLVTSRLSHSRKDTLDVYHKTSVPDYTADDMIDNIRNKRLLFKKKLL